MSPFVISTAAHHPGAVAFAVTAWVALSLFAGWYWARLNRWGKPE